jgi:predicted nucleic acid-binding Zn ribbon protein
LADKASDHRHCPVCGKAMGTGDRLCSPECEKAMVTQRKKQQRTMYIFMGVLVLFMVVLYLTGGNCSSTAAK